MAVNKNTGTMKSVSFGAEKLEDLEVVWSHLAKPDMEYKSGHSVTVKVTKALKEYIKQVQAQSGVDKINGMKKTDDGDELIKFGTKIYSNDGVERFPNIYDTDGQKSGDVPFGGDKVSVVVRPKVWDMNGQKSVSIYLQEVMVLESSGGGGVTFQKPKPKQEGISFEKQQDDDEDLPF
tara:strand:- start:208 stop:741 length:534 start_codon:yes stop_codon:yes gene_type:complete